MLSNKFDKNLDGTGLKVAIIRARFNQEITDSLLNACIDGLVDHNVSKEDITVFDVPGSFEIILAAKKAAISGEFDTVITIGAVIKGDTPHFDYISQAVTAGIVQVNLEIEIPVIFGVLTVLNFEQAQERSKSDKTNKGYEMALASIEMVRVCEKIDEL
jgi:6,7-dimethyl-8-ribityllumazine synthase